SGARSTGTRPVRADGPPSDAGASDGGVGAEPRPGAFIAGFGADSGPADFAGRDPEWAACPWPPSGDIVVAGRFALVALFSRFTSVMLQMGHSPGWSCTTCGCIGQ